MMLLPSQNLAALSRNGCAIPILLCNAVDKLQQPPVHCYSSFWQEGTVLLHYHHSIAMVCIQMTCYLANRLPCYHIRVMRLPLLSLCTAQTTSPSLPQLLPVNSLLVCCCHHQCAARGLAVQRWLLQCSPCTAILSKRLYSQPSKRDLLSAAISCDSVAIRQPCCCSCLPPIDCGLPYIVLHSWGCCCHLCYHCYHLLTASLSCIMVVHISAALCSRGN